MNFHNYLILKMIYIIFSDLGCYGLGLFCGLNGASSQFLSFSMTNFGKKKVFSFDENEAMSATYKQ